MNNHSKLIEELVGKSRYYLSDRVYFLPNQDRRWLDFTLSEALKQTKHSKILVIGGVLYGSYLSTKSLDVTVIEKNPLAAILQLYVCYLLNKGLDSDQIKERLLLDKFIKPDGRYVFESKCAKSEYKSVLSNFSKFCHQKSETVDKIFQKAFRVKIKKDSVLIKISPKGFDIASFANQKFRLPKKIIISDISGVKDVGEEYDLIVTNNTIDFFDGPEDFMDIMLKFIKPSSVIEITTYRNDIAEYLSRRFNNRKKQDIGKAYVYEKATKDAFVIKSLVLTLGINIFFVSGDEILREKHIPNLPYWLDQLVKVSRYKKKYSLFGTKDKYVTCSKEKLLHQLL